MGVYYMVVCPERKEFIEAENVKMGGLYTEEFQNRFIDLLTSDWHNLPVILCNDLAEGEWWDKAHEENYVDRSKQ